MKQIGMNGGGPVREALYAIHQPEGDCIAARERAFALWAQDMLDRHIDPR